MEEFCFFLCLLLKLCDILLSARAFRSSSTSEMNPLFALCPFWLNVVFSLLSYCILFSFDRHSWDCLAVLISIIALIGVYVRPFRCVTISPVTYIVVLLCVLALFVLAFWFSAGSLLVLSTTMMPRKPDFPSAFSSDPWRPLGFPDEDTFCNFLDAFDHIPFRVQIAICGSSVTGESVFS